MMGAGSLSDRVTFQRATLGDDGYGNTITGWSDHLTVWANVRETLGKERVDAGRVEAARTATIRVRQSPDTLGLTESDRVMARGQLWNVRSIVRVGNDGAMLDILVEAGVAT